MQSSKLPAFRDKSLASFSQRPKLTEVMMVAPKFLVTFYDRLRRLANRMFKFYRLETFVGAVKMYKTIHKPTSAQQLI